VMAGWTWQDSTPDWVEDKWKNGKPVGQLSPTTNYKITA
jgi:hypothetical protein